MLKWKFDETSRTGIFYGLPLETYLEGNIPLIWYICLYVIIKKGLKYMFKVVAEKGEGSQTWSWPLAVFARSVVRIMCVKRTPFSTADSLCVALKKIYDSRGIS